MWGWLITPVMGVYITVGFFLSVFFVLSSVYVLATSGFSFEFALDQVDFIEYSIVFSFDFISFGYSSCILLVSTSVFVFSVVYMKGTKNYRRFFYLLLMFILSMLVMVSAENFITILVGWDGLGLTSFCLVVFYDSPGSLSSGILTVLTNRLGDSMFVCSLFYFLLSGGFSVNNHFCFSLLMCTLLVGGSMTKSAQLPFCSWLPAAMAAPTPVSSLVHSSTLVTAGVYVLLRFNYVFSYLGWLISSVGLITMLVAGLSAYVETDFKKLIAMSTLSQLGVMMYSVSVGLWKLTMFHMMLHSFFKSMMFVSMGNVILSGLGKQEFRYNFSLINIKISLFSGLVSSMNLSGFPFVLGFYSKDLIISESLVFSSFFVILFFFFGCLVTVMYSFRFLSDSFDSSFLGFSMVKSLNSFLFFCSLVFLSIVSIFLGLFMSLLVLDSFVLIGGFDLVLGLFLVFLSLFFMGWRFTLISFFSSLVFMNWLSGGGVSHDIVFYRVHWLDLSWLDYVGSLVFFFGLMKDKIYFDFHSSLKFIMFLFPSIILVVS